jgi:hypothetical protein
MGLMIQRPDLQTVSVCVSNLPNETSDAEIRTLFSQYASILALKRFSGEPYHKSRGFCYLDMSSEAVEKVVSAFDGYVLDGSILHVSPMSWTDRALTTPGNRSTDKKNRLDEETPNSLHPRRYSVISVEEVSMPTGGAGDNWCRYVLSSGEAQITGFHRGSLDEVSDYAASCAEDFNLRSAAGKSTRALAFLALSKKS